MEVAAAAMALVVKVFEAGVRGVAGLVRSMLTQSPACLQATSAHEIAKVNGIRRLWTLPVRREQRHVAPVLFLGVCSKLSWPSTYAAVN